MFAKVFVFCAVLVAVSAHGLISTGTSSIVREQDGKGNYAFQYDIASNGAKRSRSEIGGGHGMVKTAYAVADSHIAPVKHVVAHAVPVVKKVAAVPIFAKAAPAVIAHVAPMPLVAKAAPVLVQHVAPMPVMTKASPFMVQHMAPMPVMMAKPSPVFAHVAAMPMMPKATQQVVVNQDLGYGHGLGGLGYGLGGLGYGLGGIRMGHDMGYYEDANLGMDYHDMGYDNDMGKYY